MREFALYQGAREGSVSDLTGRREPDVKERVVAILDLESRVGSISFWLDWVGEVRMS